MNIVAIHDDPWRYLLSLIGGRLPHALLIAGQRGIGKTALTLAYAKALLCESRQADGNACGKCQACNWFELGNHPDFRLLQPQAAEEGDTEEGKKKASQQITIEQVRSISDFVNVGSHRSGYKVIVVNPAEAMNRATANSLLKTLEEPTPGTLFLLVSNEPLRLLPTIRSRCQVVPIPIPSTARSIQMLESMGVHNAEHWLAFAGGAPVLAKELADSGKGELVTLIAKQLGTLNKQDPIKLATEIEKLLKDGKGRHALHTVVDVFQKWFVDLMLAREGLPVRYFSGQKEAIGKLAAMIPPTTLAKAYRALLTKRREAEQPLNVRLFLEGLFMDYLSLLHPTER